MGRRTPSPPSTGHGNKFRKEVGDIRIDGGEALVRRTGKAECRFDAPNLLAIFEIRLEVSECRAM